MIWACWRAGVVPVTGGIVRTGMVITVCTVRTATSVVTSGTGVDGMISRVVTGMNAGTGATIVVLAGMAVVTLGAGAAFWMTGAAKKPAGREGEEKEDTR